VEAKNVKIADATQGFLDGYFSTCRRSAKTRSAYRTDLAQLVEHLGAELALSDVSAEVLEEWAIELRSHEYHSVSIRRKFATARVFFAYWIRKGAIGSSPLWKIRLDLGRERFLPRCLAASDAKHLIEAAWAVLQVSDQPVTAPRDARFLHVRNLAAVEVLFATGIRVGELVSLNTKDWREDDASFVINGKGSRQRLAFLPDDRSQRAMRLYCASRRGIGADNEALFLNAAGGRLSTQGVARMVTQYAKTAGIMVKVTPHMIRHTLATLLLRFGADIRVVQEVLGHASIATTQRYTHVSKEHMLSTLRARHPNHHLNIETTPMKLAS
jgi:site-specific recombinase XerD